MSTDWRRLYNTKAWRGSYCKVAKTKVGGLKDRAFARDLLTCRMCGANVKRRADPGDPLLAVADHITPHRGDRALFFNIDNIQTLCKRCHDSAKHNEERRGYSTAVGVDGWPLDPLHPANRPGGG